MADSWSNFPPLPTYEELRESNAEQRAALQDARITLRDQFAMAALQALLSTCDVSRQGYNTELNRRSAQAYLMADAMLAERSKGGAS